MTFSLVLAAEEHVAQALALPLWAFPAIAAAFSRRDLRARLAREGRLFGPEDIKAFRDEGRR